MKVATYGRSFRRHPQHYNAHIRQMKANKRARKKARREARHNHKLWLWSIVAIVILVLIWRAL